MPNAMPSEIVDDVRRVLEKSSTGKGVVPSFLTAYQILDRLPKELRQRLIDERRIGGAGAGVYYSAASVVADAAERVPGVIVNYLDTASLQFQIDGHPVALTAGNTVCGIYRLDEGRASQ